MLLHYTRIILNTFIYINKTNFFTIQVYLKASAWYAATYTFEENWEYLQEKRLLGLPWILDDVIAIIKCQQPSLFPRDINVNAAVGGSLVRLFDEEKAQLLELIKERMRVKDLVEAHLKISVPNLSIFFTGTSLTMLFHHKSSVEICVINKDTRDRCTDIEADTNLLETLKCHLKAETDQNMTNIFCEVYLQNKTHFPVRM